MTSQAIALDPAVALALRTSMVLLFAGAALHKVLDWEDFRRTVAAYRLLPLQLVDSFAVAIVATEAAVVIGYLLPNVQSPTAALAVLLLATYTAAIAANLVRGIRDIDCGCAASSTAQRLHPLLIARNGLLIVGAVMAGAPIKPRPLVWFDAVSIIGAVACTTLLWNAGSRLLALHTGPPAKSLP